MIDANLLGVIGTWQSERIVRVVVARIEGSAPREAGACMWVGEHNFEGTIGGGRLEYEALEHARELLSASPDLPNWHQEGRSWPLGPRLGQCCGGMVHLLFQLVNMTELEEYHEQMAQADQMSLLVHAVDESMPPLLIGDRHELHWLPFFVGQLATKQLRGEGPRKPELVGEFSEECWFIEPLPTPRKPLFIYGAGHVGRAIVKSVEDLDFAVTWVDTHKHRFPQNISFDIDKIVAQHPQHIASKAPAGTYHLILTYSHEIDFELCATLLAQNSFGFLGLIGSKTKRARFIKRLRERGIVEQALSRLTCPIGIDDIRGKQPASIAVAVAAQLLQKCEEQKCQQIFDKRSAHGLAK